MGATAAAMLLVDGLRVGRLVMVAPMASVAAYTRRFIVVLGAGARIQRRLVARIEKRVQASLHNFELPDVGRMVAMPPTLILHDRSDATIPVTDGEAIAAAWPSARLRITSGLGHRRLLSDPDSVAAVVDFVTA
jgi:pimeloyl-ACP methyl ester carboxylesterase